MPEDPSIIIKFEGGDADRHLLDMRLLGRSYVGLDRIVSAGVILLSEGRAPRRGERAALIVKAKEPKTGSVETITTLQEQAGMLGLGWQIFKDSGGEIVCEWLKFVLEYWAGNKDKSDKALEAMLQLNRDHLAARDKADERNVAALKDITMQALDIVKTLGRAANEAVAPIGPSARSGTIRTAHGHPFAVDEPMADAIRAKGEVEVSELQELVLTADGWTYHSRLLNVHHPERPGRFISAKVRDPLGEVDGNVYADAARDKATVVVQGKIARRAGEIEGIYIMDFGSRRDFAA
jgi:hypothetical protein